MSSKPEHDAKDAEPRRPYQRPTLTYVGDLVDVVQSGGGKASLTAPDGPDVRKPPGK